MRILAFESSCDESSVAVIESGKVVSLRTVTQSVHQQFGGVVPELAGRSHLELMDRLTHEAIEQAPTTLSGIHEIAATVGPGLVGSLLVGSNYARGLSLALGLRFRPMHHLEAHLWSAEIEYEPLPLPFVVLLVSGGHTLTVLVKGLREYTILGSTLDDALGEAYDKVGKLVGLGFPAGAEIDKLAVSGDALSFALMRSSADTSMDFSFSGLKTAVLYTLRDHPEILQNNRTPDLLASFQEFALTSVINKVRRAVEATEPRAIVTAGGVAANSRLRTLLSELAATRSIPAIFPPIKYCMDNAAMIGYLAWKLAEAGITDCDTSVHPRWPLSALSAERAAA